MKLPILLIVVISIAWAKTENVGRSARAPQEQIKHVDGDSRINWDLYLAPQSQLQRANAHRPQRAEGGSPLRLRQAQQHRAPASAPQPQPQQVQQQAQGPQYYSYKPYSAVPSHIRQLINSVYQPQAPYVDPTSFIYGGNHFAAAPQQREQQQLAPAASEDPRGAYLQPSARYQSIDAQRAQPRYEYSDRRVERQDRIAYKEDYEQQQQQQQLQQQLQQQQQQQQLQQPQVAFPLGAIPEPPLPTLYLDRNMPSEIKQLLQYQAQIPYDVTANRIQYKPKSTFIPKPLSDDVKGPYYYRSKVYYPSDDNVDAEYQQDKPVEEGQRH